MYRYNGIQRLLHWLVALMVIGLLASGFLVWYLGFDGVTSMLGDARRDMLYEYHKTFGLIVLGLMALRLFVRLERGKPEYEYDIGLLERLLAAIVQYLFYILLIAQPILGWLATDARSFPVEFFSWNLPDFIPKSPQMDDMGKALYKAHTYVGWGPGGADRPARRGRTEALADRQGRGDGPDAAVLGGFAA